MLVINFRGRCGHRLWASSGKLNSRLEVTSSLDTLTVLLYCWRAQHGALWTTPQSLLSSMNHVNFTFICLILASLFCKLLNFWFRGSLYVSYRIPMWELPTLSYEGLLRFSADSVEKKRIFLETQLPHPAHLSWADAVLPHRTVCDSVIHGLMLGAVRKPQVHSLCCPLCSPGSRISHHARLAFGISSICY